MFSNHSPTQINETDYREIPLVESDNIKLKILSERWFYQSLLKIPIGGTERYNQLKMVIDSPTNR